MVNLIQFRRLMRRFNQITIVPLLAFTGLTFLMFATKGYAQAQPFTDITAKLAGVANSSVAWGDYDSDGDLDILLTGADLFSNRTSKVYRNDNGNFIDINASLQPVASGSAAWGDYDNDGDLDILLTGEFRSGGRSNVYRNDGGSFVDVNAALIGTFSTSVAWGDYDNDGDLDILLTGYPGFSKIYKNENGSFMDISASLRGVWAGAAAWGDYDNDGDLDILLAGRDPDSNLISKVYRNNDGIFEDLNAPLIGVWQGAAAWGDYDNDGDLDILLTGLDSNSVISKIYRNDGGNFADIDARLVPVAQSSAAWGDYDNDGDLDILLGSKVYRNDGGNFMDINAGLIEVSYSSAAWGDYDNDGDLDIVLTDLFSSKIYRNNIAAINTAPTPPIGLTSSVSGSTVTLSWNKSTDNETTQNALTYNLRVGTSSGGVQIVAPMSEVESGHRRIPQFGNINHRNSWTLRDLPDGTIYWSVQAIDHAFAGSAFAPEQSFTLAVPPAPPQNLKAIAGIDQITLRWNQNNESDFLRYRVYGGTAPKPAGLIDSTSSRNDTTITIIGLIEGTAYYFRITALDSSYYESNYSNEVMAIPALFKDVSASLPGVRNGSTVWGDYDNDGDLDILLTGEATNLNLLAKVYRNDGGNLVDINAALTGVYGSAVAWGDYDNDGDLDILLTGDTNFGNIAKVYRNDSGSFVDIDAALARVYVSSVAWGDYDNDGDLDILMTGSASSGDISKVYRNDKGNFVDLNAALQGVWAGSVAWGDYDNDGDLDILLAGSSSGTSISKVYRNEGGDFVDINAPLAGVQFGDMAWGDYDNDGDLDILLTGSPDEEGLIAEVYRNDDGNFVDINAGLLGVTYSSVAWGDYDSDGDLDILLTGEFTDMDVLAPVFKIYRNDEGAFVDINIALENVRFSSVTWGDYDKDGDLDILSTGSTSSDRISIIYRNNIKTPNTFPMAPQNLTSVVLGDSVILNWGKANDKETVQNSLTYNLRMGTTSGGMNTISPMANSITGYRRIPAMGNINHNITWRVKGLRENKYYWSVQAIDHALAGSVFAEEGSFVVGEPPRVKPQSPSFLPEDQDASIVAIISDNVGVATAILHYRRGGEVTFRETSMAPSNGMYRGTIPAFAVTHRGVEFFITATDSVGFEQREPSSGIYSIKVKVPATGVAKDTLQTYGTEQKAYRLVSIPIDLDNRSVKSILEDELGQYNIKKWRFYELLLDIQNYLEYSQNPGMEMTPGKAYWLIVKEQGKRIGTGAGTSFRTDTVFSIVLHPQWNFVSNPFNFSIPIRHIHLTSTKQSPELRVYEGAWIKKTGASVTMKPFEGYAVFNDRTMNNSPAKDTLIINPNLADSTNSFLKVLASTNILWSIRISAQCDEARDVDNVAAVIPSASRDWDLMDQPEPPVIGEYVSVYFPHNEWKKLASKYCTDARPGPTKGEVWNFEVKTNVRDNVNLAFEGVESVSEEFEVWFVDEAINLARNLRETNGYTFVAFGSDHPKSLKLVVGESDFIQKQLADIQAIPTRYELAQSFPNPFNLATTIRYDLAQAEHVTLKIYNLLGEEVVTLLDNEPQAAGYHVAIWNGRNKLGEVVGSGVYVYRFRAGSFTSIKKMALVK